jgi:hypothetical protein
LPIASEVAAIIPDISPDWHQRTFRDMILQLCNANPGTLGLERVDPSHAAYLPLHYVLLFPYGDQGWHWNLILQHQNDNLDLPRQPTRELDEPEEITDQLIEDNVNPDTTIEVVESHKMGHLTMQNFYAYQLFT